MSLQSLSREGINETKEGLGMNRTGYFCISESIKMDHMGRNIGGEREECVMRGVEGILNGEEHKMFMVEWAWCNSVLTIRDSWI